MDTHDRGHNGQFERTPDTAERDAEAATLRSRGLTYQQIADQLGFAHRSAARKAVQRVLQDTVTEPADELRKLELDRLDTMWRTAMDVLARDHLAHSLGRVVTHQVPVLDSDGHEVIDPETGEPMTRREEVHDDGPKLAAIDRLLKIQDRRAKLLGLDAPTKSRVEVITQDQIEAEIERLSREIAEQEQHERQQEEAAAGGGED